MIKVYEKTEQELNKEYHERYVYSKMVRGKPLPVCPYYVIKKDGTKMDADKLSEKEVIGLCKNSIEFSAGNIKLENEACSLKDACKLVRSLEKNKDFTKLSCESLCTIIDLFNSSNKQIASQSKDMLMSIAKKQVDEVEIIAKFLNESAGCFKKPTAEQKKIVATQIESNEKKKANKTEFGR